MMYSVSLHAPVLPMVTDALFNECTMSVGAYIDRTIHDGKPTSDKFSV